MLVCRAALEVVGLLDEDYFLHCRDLDWFECFRRADWKLYLVPDVEVVYHQDSCQHRSRLIAVEWYKHKGMSALHLVLEKSVPGWTAPYWALATATCKATARPLGWKRTPLSGSFPG